MDHASFAELVEHAGRLPASWNREEERYSASRLHQSLAQRGNPFARSAARSQPRAAASDSDDHFLDRGRSDTRRTRNWRWIGAARRHCRHHHRRTNTLPGPNPSRSPGDLLFSLSDLCCVVDGTCYTRLATYAATT